MSLNEDILEKVERLKIILTRRATHETKEQDEVEYLALRKELMRTALAKSTLPRFVRTCRNLTDFWNFIQPKFSTYRERRNYLRAEFENLFTVLEEDAARPADEIVSGQLEVVDSPNVREAWEKMLVRRNEDPSGAITVARTLVESVCKHILHELGEQSDYKGDLQRIYKATARVLDLAPNPRAEEGVKQVLRGCVAAVNGLCALSNAYGDRHPADGDPEQRHVELALNAAGTVASFLIATWEMRTGEDG